MEITEEEKNLILENRLLEEEGKPKKTAYLKHNLYFFSSKSINSNGLCGSFITKKEIDNYILSIRKSFKLYIVPANTKFVCFMNNKKESWYDDYGYGIEKMSAEWAKIHLINIKNI